MNDFQEGGEMPIARNVRMRHNNGNHDDEPRSKRKTIV